MLNILVNSYAISPRHGSEPGMGWNWVIHLAKYCRLHVITEGEWQQDIEEEVAKLPQRENLVFYYMPVSGKVRRMCWNQGDWRFYYYYRKWQKKALTLARDIIAQYPIDVVHQLNMIGYREPGYLWKIEGIPYVWGPVGGTDLMPWPYLTGTGWRQLLFCGMKNVINSLQRKYHPRVRCAIMRANVLIAAVQGVDEVFDRYYHKSSFLINETGTSSISAFPPRQWKQRAQFDVLWVGKFDFRKQLELAIRAIAATHNKNIHLHICGTGSDKQERFYRQIAEQCDIATRCHWYGELERSEVETKMQQYDLLLFTSIMEATSTVVPEAIDAGLPVLSFNTCGFGSLVKTFAGRTIELSTPEQSIEEFAIEINELEANRCLLEKISAREMAQRDSLSWDSKARKMVELYNNIASSTCKIAPLDFHISS